MGRIELKQVDLTFRVRQQPGRKSFKEAVVRRLTGRASAPLVKVRALRGVNLRIGAGERVGILGHNGAGKSTLLKLLAGIYTPTRGKRVVNGQISSLFDIALGFEPEATGWENIFYRGYLQGETPRSIAPKVEAIAEFTELGDFLKVPVRYYSAGMMVRLAFSIATAVEPEILLVDEVLSVGDSAFQDKARKRMDDMMSRAELIVMVSHDLSSLTRLCDRGIWMEQGRVRLDGPIKEAAAAYTRATLPGASQPSLVGAQLS
jgi:ABC-type polysaccharide/polyol phosphate transport system ATPase subunit